MPSVLETAIERNRAELLSGDAAALGRMRNAYDPVRTRLLAQIDELVKVLESSGELTGGQAMRLERAQMLLTQVEEELQRFASPAGSFIESAQRQAVTLATAHVQATIFAQDPSLSLSFNRLNSRAVTELVGRMSDGSPLRSWLDALGPDTAATMERSILDGLALGQSPRTVARDIGRALAKDVDMAGYRILNHTRSQMLGAYRGATMERYQQNADIIESWEWISAKQKRSCRACIALDGRRFPLTVKFQASHNSCRCSSIAVLPGVTIDRELGRDWLAKQDEATQDAILGKQGGAEYRAGLLSLDDFVTLKKDNRWGDSYQASTLEDARKRAGTTGLPPVPRTMRKTVKPKTTAKPSTVAGADDPDTLAKVTERGGQTLEPARAAVPKPKTPLTEWTPVRSDEDARAWARQTGGTLADKTFYHFTQDEFVDSIKREGLRVGGGSYGEFVYATAKGDYVASIGARGQGQRLSLVTNVKTPLRIKSELLFDKKKGLGKYKINGRDLLYTDKFPRDKVRDLLGADGYDSVIVDFTTDPYGQGKGEWLLAFDTKDLTIIDEVT